MKRLYLVRHAKSSWKHPYLEDMERPLNKRGKRDAPLMGKYLAANKVKPDLIISSPARRAIETARTIAEELGYSKKKIVAREEIYEAGENKIIDTIRETDNEVETLMVFGHNPGFTILANTLSNCNIDNIPTCGVFCVDFDIGSWAELDEKKGKFVFFDYPKNIDPEKYK